LKIETTDLDGVVILTPRIFHDVRGSFCESWSRAALASVGIDLEFVQDNQSLSHPVNTVRGLHYQSPPHAQDKLVRAAMGVILDVAVDVRRGSPTYGKSVVVELSAQNGRQLLVPKGFLHGFITKTPDTLVMYKTTDVYAPDCDGCVYFADPDLGIDWGIAADQAVLSEKDTNAPRFADWVSPFTYES
jgi:dTDP-4-dehydrorhamnose 3,5-epimerase